MFTSKIKITVTLFIILIVFPVGATWWLFNTPLISKQQTEITFTFTPGSSVTKLANELHRQGILKHPSLLIFLSNLTKTSKYLQAGEYSINHRTTLWQLWLQLKKGQVVLYSFVIVEGWTFDKLITTLENDPNITHTLIGLNSNEIMKLIGHEGEIPEGRFFPETYKFPRNTKDTDILIMSYLLMEIKLNQAWMARAPEAPYNCPYKALIAASIIEKEASRPEELAIISGVIVRRLQQDMYLQMDPTVIYGLGTKYSGNLTINDLQLDTVYNTYLHKSLPPTPICLPGEKAIYAAMHPDKSNLLYFVAKGDGSHEFSSTLEEHNLAVQKYRNRNCEHGCEAIQEIMDSN